MIHVASKTETGAEFDNRIGCPACARRDKGAEFFVCTVCWPKIPGGDRQQLNAMRLRKQCCRSKLASVVRALKEAGCGEVHLLLR